jgi:hypothetical protein
MLKKGLALRGSNLPTHYNTRFLFDSRTPPLLLSIQRTGVYGQLCLTVKLIASLFYFGINIHLRQVIYECLD